MDIILAMSIVACLISNNCIRATVISIFFQTAIHFHWQCLYCSTPLYWVVQAVCMYAHARLFTRFLLGLCLSKSRPEVKVMSKFNHLSS
jgi:RsiW-degrading membrane proteinase PrsW (M82 family)